MISPTRTHVCTCTVYVQECLHKVNILELKINVTNVYIRVYMWMLVLSNLALLIFHSHSH